MSFAHHAIVITIFAAAASAQEPAAPDQASALRYAQIVVAQTQPRCFASDRSPLFVDQLSKGQVVRVGAAANGFVPVVLPMGVTGFVHAKYCTEPDQGVVRTTGARVSFRYRAQSGEAPTAMLAKDVELFYLETDKDWLKVRYAGAEAYLPEAELQVFTTSDATVEASYRELELQRRKVWQDAIAARAAVAAAAVAQGERMTQLDTFEERLRAEATKPAEQRDFAPLQGELSAFAANLEAQSPEALRAKLLAGKIDEQALLARAIHAVKEEPRRAEPVPLGAAPVPDGLSRFDAVGWLRYSRSMDGRERVTLEKGGRLLHVVTCRSARYDLRLFDGTEVGVIGPREREIVDSVRVLDALKIEVLNNRR